MYKKLRKIYAVVFVLLLFIEIYIAAFVTNIFVRSYLGDVFITLLICCFLAAVIPKRIRPLPIYVFIFSAVVELCQYFDVVKLLGLEDFKFISVWFGRYFSFYDIICYAAGCILFFLIDLIGKKIIER